MPSDENLINQIEQQLRDELMRLKDIPSPTSVKGGSYEDILKEFFEKYLRSIYDFYTRVTLVDYLGLHKFIFDPKENEFDLVATYKTSVPKIFLQYANYYIPYDAAAFIVQIKQDLDKNKLQMDLEKLRKLRSLPLSQNRIPVSIIGLDPVLKVGGSSIDPLNILIYVNQRTKKSKSIEDLLRDFKDCWDLVLVLSQNKLYVNYQVLKSLIELSYLRLERLGLLDNNLQRNFEEVRKDISRELFLIIDRNPIISMVSLIPTVLPYPIICNASSILIFTLFPEFKNIIHEALLKAIERWKPKEK